jgi:hypothetical protein
VDTSPKKREKGQYFYDFVCIEKIEENRRGKVTQSLSVCRLLATKTKPMSVCPKQNDCFGAFAIF